MADDSKSGYSKEAREFIHEHTKKHMDEDHMKQDQAVAAAMSEARRKGMKVPSRKSGEKKD